MALAACALERDLWLLARAISGSVGVLKLRKAVQTVQWAPASEVQAESPDRRATSRAAPAERVAMGGGACRARERPTAHTARVLLLAGLSVSSDPEPADEHARKSTSMRMCIA